MFINPVKIALCRAVLTITMRRNIVKNIFPSNEEKQKLLTQLNLLGAKEVFVEFRGGGDEGEVESVYYRNRQDESLEIPNDMISWTEVSYGDKLLETKQMLLVDVLEDLCYRALDEASMDWCNNEGGQGHLHIDFTESPPKISLQLGINTMSTDDYSYDIDDDEEDE
jgi:hypothetical protein